MSFLWLLGLEDNTLRGRVHLPLSWLPKVQPEVEELEPTVSGPGQQVAEKHELGRLQYSLDYDFQTGQVGVEDEEALEGKIPGGSKREAKTRGPFSLYSCWWASCKLRVWQPWIWVALQTPTCGFTCCQTSGGGMRPRCIGRH